MNKIQPKKVEERKRLQPSAQNGVRDINKCFEKCGFVGHTLANVSISGDEKGD